MGLWQFKTYCRYRVFKAFVGGKDFFDLYLCFGINGNTAGGNENGISSVVPLRTRTERGDVAGECLQGQGDLVSR